MRLIDADALYKLCKEDLYSRFAHNHNLSSIVCAALDYFMGKIKSMPTIEAEPVKHGFDTGDCRLFCCSECGYGVNDIFVEDERRHLLDIGPIFRYCPNCGAKMDWEVTENDT